MPPAPPLVIGLLTSLPVPDRARRQARPGADTVEQPLTREKLNTLLHRYLGDQ